MKEIEKRKIIFLNRRFIHHGGYSGYGQLTKYVAGEVLTDELSPTQDDLFEKYVARMNRSVAYKTKAFALEIEAVTSMLRPESCIYHVLYMEQSYQFLGSLNPLQRHNIVGTFHEPPNLIHRLFRGKAKQILRQPDAVIALSRDLAGYLCDVIRHPNVFFIPLGIDTSFFRPREAQKIRKSKICSFVGEHLRDFVVLQEIIRAFESRQDVRFQVVVPDTHFHLFGAFKNVELFHDISDAELRDLYHRSDMIIFPFKDCVGSLALLEAAASGLPIVATSVGGTKDYLDDSCAYLVPKNNVPAMIDAIQSLLKDEDLMSRMGSNSRQKALEFDWKIVAERTENVYEKITSPYTSVNFSWF